MLAAFSVFLTIGNEVVGYDRNGQVDPAVLVALDECREMLRSIRSIEFSYSQLHEGQEPLHSSVHSVGDLYRIERENVPLGKLGATTTVINTYDGMHYQDFTKETQSLTRSATQLEIGMSSFATPLSLTYGWKATDDVEQSLAYLNSDAGWGSVLERVHLVAGNQETEQIEIGVDLLAEKGDEVVGHINVVLKRDPTYHAVSWRMFLGTNEEPLRSVEVTETRNFDVEGLSVVIPVGLTYSQKLGFGQGAKTTRTLFSVEPESIVLNSPIAAELFTIPESDARELYDPGTGQHTALDTGKTLFVNEFGLTVEEQEAADLEANAPLLIREVKRHWFWLANALVVIVLSIWYVLDRRHRQES